MGKIQGFNIINLLQVGKGIICHANLFPLINVGSPSHKMKEDSQSLGRFDTVDTRVSPDRKNPRQVMVIPEEGIPALTQF